MVRFQCENEGCRLYHKEYEYGSDEANPGRCLSCRLPMAKFLTVDMDVDRKNAIDSFLEVTAEPWGTPVIQSLKDAAKLMDNRNEEARHILDTAKLMDDQDIPLNGRAVFQPGVGVLYDPAERVVSLLEKNDQIDRSFLSMIRMAHSHRAFYVESRLRELHRELSAIINIEEGD